MAQVLFGMPESTFIAAVRRSWRSCSNSEYLRARRIQTRQPARASARLQATISTQPNMPLLELLTSSGLGSLLGMRHALEPDHLAAVTTLVSREQSGARAALLGMCWGLGHTLTLVAVGVVLIVLRAEMPPSVSDFFELTVS